MFTYVQICVRHCFNHALLRSWGATNAQILQVHTILIDSLREDDRKSSSTLVVALCRRQWSPQ